MTFLEPSLSFKSKQIANMRDLERIVDFLRDNEFVISVMEPYLILYAYKLAIPSIFIDSLFWYWEWNEKRLVEALRKIEKGSLRQACRAFDELSRHERRFISHYLATEGFIQKVSLEPLCEHRIEKLKTITGPGSMHIIGPIIDDRFKIENHAPSDLNLVSYGGVENFYVTVSKNAVYPEIITKAFLRATDRANQIRICTNISIVSSLRRIIRKNRNIEICFLPHKEFLRTLNMATLVLIPGGLTTAFESFAYEKCVAFLPSQHYGQVENMKILSRENVAPFHLSWFSLLELGKEVFEGGEADVTLRIISLMEKYRNDETLLQKLSSGLKEFLNLSICEKKKAVKKQSSYLQGLGGNGLYQILETLRCKFRID